MSLRASHPLLSGSAQPPNWVSRSQSAPDPAVPTVSAASASPAGEDSSGVVVGVSEGVGLGVGEAVAVVGLGVGVGLKDGDGVIVALELGVKDAVGAATGGVTGSPPHALSSPTTRVKCTGMATTHFPTAKVPRANDERPGATGGSCCGELMLSRSMQIRL